MVIKFSQKSLPPLEIIVEVRSCSVGEALAANGTICTPCNAATYNFQPTEETGCQPCPENAKCTSAVIVPIAGFWHQSPCSNHIQRCLTDNPCGYKDRETKLDAFVEHLDRCNLTDNEILEYANLQCTEVRLNVLFWQRCLEGTYWAVVWCMQRRVWKTAFL